MTLKRPRTLDLDALIYPIEAAELFGVPYQRIQKLWMTGKLPEPVKGRYRLREFLRGYISYVERSAREEATGRANLNILAGL